MAWAARDAQETKRLKTAHHASVPDGYKEITFDQDIDGMCIGILIDSDVADADIEFDDLFGTGNIVTLSGPFYLEGRIIRIRSAGTTCTADQLHAAIQRT